MCESDRKGGGREREGGCVREIGKEDEGRGMSMT